MEGTEEKQGDLLKIELDPSLLVHYKTLPQFFDKDYIEMFDSLLLALNSQKQGIEHSNKAEELQTRTTNYSFGSNATKMDDVRKHLYSKGITDKSDQDFIFFLWSQKTVGIINKNYPILAKPCKSLTGHQCIPKNNMNPNGIINKNIEGRIVKIHINSNFQLLPKSELMDNPNEAEQVPYEIDILINLENKTVSFENAVLSINEKLISQEKFKELEKFKIPEGRYLIQTPEIKNAKSKIEKVKLKIEESDQELAKEFKQAAYLKMTWLPTVSTPDENKPEVLYHNVVKEIVARKNIKISKQKLLNIFDFSRKPSKWRYVLFGSLILLGAITTIGALLSGFGVIPLVLSTGWLYGLGGGGIISTAIGIGGTVKQIESESIEQDTVQTPPDSPLTSTARMISDQGGKQHEAVVLHRRKPPETKQQNQADDYNNVQQEGDNADPDNNPANVRFRM